MKKQLFRRSFCGMISGIAIGYLITVILSLFWGEGEYLPCMPQLIDTMGNEASAVAFQTGLSALLGIAFGAGSLIWDQEDWSLFKQTALYLLLSSAAMFPVAWLAHWMEHSLSGFLSYAAAFLAIFLIAWLSQYLFWRRRVRKLDETIRKNF